MFIKISHYMLVLCIAVSILSCSSGDSPSRFYTRPIRQVQMPTEGLIRAVAWSGKLGLFAAFGDPAAIFVSSDGYGWREVFRDTSNVGGFRHAIWDGRRFVVTATSRLIEISPGVLTSVDSVITMSSEDGYTWHKHRKSNFPFMTQLARADTLTLGSGSKNEVYYSLDYDDWRKVTWYGSPHHGLFAAAWFKNTYIVGGFFGMIRISTDAINWTSVNNKPYEWIRAFASNDSTIIAMGGPGYSLTSTDARSWSLFETDIETEIKDIVWTGKEFVAVGDGMYASEDGIRWRTILAPGQDNLRAVAVSDARLVAVGWDGHARVMELD